MRATIKDLIKENKAQYDLFKALAEDKTVEVTDIIDKDMLSKLVKGNIVRINFSKGLSVVEPHSALVKYVVKETFEIMKAKGFEPKEFPFGWEDEEKKDPPK